jgi:hypothetical protein
MTGRGRIVRLRDGEDGRYLDVWRDAAGGLHIDGQDLGTATSVASSRGEYEWFQTVAGGDVPRLLELLGAPSDADILDVLDADWRGARATELERRLRDSDIDVKRHIV